MRALLLLSITAALATGCRIGAAPGNAAATRDAPSLVAIPTADPPDVHGGCMDALMTGQLMADDEVGLVIAEGGPPVVVIWPHGWVAMDQDGMRILLNERGDQIARVGDHLQLAGGMVDERWLACGEITQLP